MNNVSLIGRLVRDPDLRYNATDGKPILRITIAVDRELTKEKKELAINNEKPTADFISVITFGKLAENCANYLSKGRECAVSGKIYTSSYISKSGEKRYTTEVIANRVEFIGGKGQSSTEKETEPDISFFEGLPEDDDVFNEAVEE